MAKTITPQEKITANRTSLFAHIPYPRKARKHTSDRIATTDHGNNINILNRISVGEAYPKDQILHICLTV
jgi:hypothetical protein